MKFSLKIGATALTASALVSMPAIAAIAQSSTPAPANQPDPFIQNLPALGIGILFIVIGGIAGPVLQRRREAREAKKKRDLNNED